MKLILLSLLSAMTLHSLAYDSATRPDAAHAVPLLADAVAEPGRILAVDALGYGVPAADVEGLIVLGRINAPVDATGKASGELMATFDTGCFSYANSGAAPVTEAHYGRPIFIENDVTVTASAGVGNVFAGFCRGFDGDKVWVDMRPLPMVAAFFGSHPNGNFRISADATGAPLFQLWNQSRGVYQTVQLDGLAGVERFIVG